MKYGWHKSKEATLAIGKRPSFEAVVLALSQGGYVDEIENSRFPGQTILIVRVQGEKHLCAVPFTKSGEVIFLHTIYPDRKLSKRYPGR